MGRNVIEEFLALADTVRVARDLADREGSLEQACAEAQARLAGLIELEKTAVRKAGDARLEAKRVEDEASATVAKKVSEANAKLSAKENEVEARCAERIASADTDCERLAEEMDGLRASITDLAGQESELKVSIEVLTDELAALKARLG